MIRNLLAAGVLALACMASPALAQNLTVKDSTGATKTIAATADGASALHYQDIMEGWYASAPKKWTFDVNGYGGVNVQNFPTTQAVSASALPLPTGAATSALQATATGYLSTLAGTVSAGSVSVTCASGCAGSGGGSTPTGTAGSPNVAVLSVQGVSGGTGVPISATSLPLPSGAATSALQTTGNTSLSSILTQLQGLLTTKTSPFTTASVITPGTPVTAGRALFLACTAAGSVRIKLSSGNTLDVPVYVGPNELTNYAVTDIVAGSTTATCVATVLG